MPAVRAATNSLRRCAVSVVTRRGPDGKQDTTSSRPAARPPGCGASQAAGGADDDGARAAQQDGQTFLLHRRMETAEDSPTRIFRGGLYCEAAAVAVGGHALGLFGFVQAEKGGVDDFVFVDQCGAGKGFALVAVVGAVADGGELALLGGEDFGQERLGASGDAIRGCRFSLGVESVFAWPRLDKQGLQGVTAEGGLEARHGR